MSLSHSLIAQLGSECGLPAFSLNGHGVARLIFDERWNVDFECEDEAGILHVYTTVGHLAEFDQATIRDRMLEANLFGRGTGGASFGLDLESGEIILSNRVLPDEITFERFKRTVQSMVDVLDAFVKTA